MHHNIVEATPSKCHNETMECTCLPPPPWDCL